MSDFRLTPEQRAGSKFWKEWRAIEYSWWSDNGHWVAGWLEKFSAKTDTSWPVSEIGNIRIVPAADRAFARKHLSDMVERQARMIAQRHGSWVDIIITEADLLKIEGRVRSQIPPSARTANQFPIMPRYVRDHEPAIAEDERHDQAEEDRAGPAADR